jgi:hypothetical protein
MAGPSGTLLSMIAQGAQPRLAEAGFQGYRQGNAMLQAQQEQERKMDLAKIAQAYGSGGPEAARNLAGQLGRLEPTMQIDKTLYGRGLDAAKSAMPVSSFGKLQYDERRNLVPAGTTQRKIGAIGSGGPTINVNTGNIPLGKKAVNETQADVLAGRSALTRIDGFMKNYKPEWLTFKGQGMNFGRRVFEKAGGTLPKPDKQALQSYTKFRQGVERDFNQYRKEITGAAAAIQELARLKDAIYNTDQSPSEFESAVEAYKAELFRMDRARIELLRRGIDPRTPEGGMQLDAIMFSDNGASPNPGVVQQPQQQDGVIDYKDFFSEDGQ